MSHPKLITLTTPLWHGDPRDGIKRLREHFNELRERPVFAAVKGGADQIVLTPSSGRWHIHMHVICDAPFIPYQHLFSAWRNIIGCVAPQVDVRAATTPQEQAYAAKYTSKSAHFKGDLSEIVSWYEATQNSRLFATFGTWYHQLPQELADDPAWLPPAPECPHCGAVHTTCYARDGPYVCGRDAWDHYRRELPREYVVPNQELLDLLV